MMIYSSLLLFLLLHSFGETTCPMGWNGVGHNMNTKCVRPIVYPCTRHEAEKKCRSEGGELLILNDHSLLQDVEDILYELYEIGLIEDKWIVASMTKEEETAILQRNKNGKYIGSHVTSSTMLPFMCSLTSGGLRNALLRDELIPKGAPHITWDMPSEVFFFPRPDGETLILRCPFKGNPPPRIVWYRNDVPLEEKDLNGTFLISGGTLLLPPISSLSYSSFHCLAISSLGSARSPPVVLKPAFLDPFPPSRLDSFPLLNGGAHLQCLPPPHQPKSLTFTWLEEKNETSGGPPLVEEDERRFVSIDGSLLFSHVKKEDDHRHACSIRVPATDSGHYGPFFRLIVPSNHNEELFAPRFEDDYPKVRSLTDLPSLNNNSLPIFPDVPLRKQTVYLECFAFGNPSPSYGWARVDGRPLPTRASLLNHGRVLRIEEVEAGDGGRYVCTAGNERGIQTARVALTIRDVPSIVIPLVDTLVSKGESLTLDCPLSTADLISTIEWFRNGRPLVRMLLSTSQRKRIRTSSSSLHISPVEVEDGAVYSCIVSNDVGSTSSSCLVEVRDLPPSFPPLSLPGKIYAVTGSSLSIPCAHQSSPRGKTQWTNANGQMIGHKGRVRENHGILHIDHVEHVDEGPYFCTVQNRLGKAHVATQLLVIDRPEILLNAKTSLTPANITCEVQLSCTSECPEPLLEWATFNDKPLHNTFRKSPVQMKEGKRNREGEESRHRIGRFACGQLYGRENEMDTETTHLPPTPIGVRIEERKGGVLIRWNMPPRRESRENERIDDAKVDGYIVEMRTKENRGWKNVSRRNIHSIGERSALLESLIPNIFYQFRVRSLSQSTRGDASLPSEWMRTPQSPPIETIDNLRWSAEGSQILHVEWDPIEKEHQSGSDLRYRVSWGDAKSAPLHSFETRLPNAKIVVNSSESCSSIVLSVLPLNNEGESTVAASTIAFLNSKGELRDVVLTEAMAVNSSTLILTWKWNEDGYCQSLYAVEINCTTDHGDTVTVSVSAEHSSFELSGLIPSAEYSCHLRPFDRRNNYGKRSNTLSVMTERHPPEAAPQVTSFGWKLEDDGSISTILEWTAVPFEMGMGGNGTRWGYKVFVSISDSSTTFDMPEERLTNPAKPSVRLEGLQPIYTYQARVAAYNAGGIGPLSESRSIRLGLRYFQLQSTASHVSILALVILLIRIYLPE